MKRISLLGSTGSIGIQTLEVIEHLGEEYSVEALAAGTQIDILEQQIQKFKPSLVAVFDDSKAKELKKRVPHLEIIPGMEGLKAVASLSSSNIVVSAITGSIGLEPTLAAIEAGKDVALANKETLVCAGDLVMNLAREKNVSILPIDSEHSALFQCLQGNDPQSVGRLILTASGGPFRTSSDQDLDQITPKLALAHPTWNMGPKVTIDSSTLMNKGLEIIEAHFLFGIPVEKIDVVIHPQSLIHSLVEYVDGSMMAQVSVPDMRLPIQLALTYPKRVGGTLAPFDFIAHPKIEFFLPDLQKFGCLKLAFEALKIGKSAPCFLNAANEVLVSSFLSGQLSWKGIAKNLEKLMARHRPCALTSVDEVIFSDTEARQFAKEII